MQPVVADLEGVPRHEEAEELGEPTFGEAKPTERERGGEGGNEEDVLGLEGTSKTLRPRFQ